ncbi:MAG: nucleoside triphosphate hydrolase [Sphingobium sp.]
MNSRPLPPLIAIVGCDGSGKSTMTEALQAWLEQIRPTVTCHLGKQSGNIGRALARLPLIGRRFDTSIRKRAQKAQSDDGPGLGTAIGIYAFVLRRAFRFRRMMRLREAGHVIIADRFPQIEVPGPMDGLGLSNARPTGMIGWLARSEKRKFAAMAAYRPDLVIRLNVSLDIAQARKPDHRPASLARKIADLAHLTYQGAPIVDLDAAEPLETVRARAMAAIAPLLQSRYGIAVPLPSVPVPAASS